MAGKYGSASMIVTYDDGPGGTGRVVTGHILEIGGVKITSALELSHALGDSWEESTPSGMAKVEAITLSGFWDTTATTGPHVVFGVPDDGPQDLTRTLVVVFGDGKTFTCESYLMSYEVKGTNGKLTQFTAEIQPSGSGVWS